MLQALLVGMLQSIRTVQPSSPSAPPSAPPSQHSPAEEPSWTVAMLQATKPRNGQGQQRTSRPLADVEPIRPGLPREALFDVVDTNGDGVIDRHEFTAFAAGGSRGGGGGSSSAAQHNPLRGAEQPLVAQPAELPAPRSYSAAAAPGEASQQHPQQQQAEGLGGSLPDPTAGQRGVDPLAQWLLTPHTSDAHTVQWQHINTQHMNTLQDTMVLGTGAALSILVAEVLGDEQHSVGDGERDGSGTVSSGVQDNPEISSVEQQLTEQELQIVQLELQLQQTQV